MLQICIGKSQEVILFMKCRQCGSKISEEFVACPYCGIRLDGADPAGASPSSSSNDPGVKEALKQLIETFGLDILKDNKKLISLLSDYIPEYEKERRLIKTVVNNDVFKTLLEGSADQKLAVNKSREYMIKELFISEGAAEFILECFTYALGWQYEPVVNYGKAYGYKDESAAPPAKKIPSASKPSASKSETHEDSNLPKKEFTSTNAMKYRFRGRANIPYGFTSIESFAFDSYKFLRVVKLPDSISVIGEYAFSECKRLKSVVLPNSLRVIKKSSFSSCERLLSINIPHGVSSIEDSAFSFCQKLTVINLPNTVSNIGTEAFSGCENLTKIKIPDSVKFIGERAFEFCPKLTIECANGSYVHKYCRANKLNFTTYEPID